MDVLALAERLERELRDTRLCFELACRALSTALQERDEAEAKARRLQAILYPPEEPRAEE
jgi:hypothetical protein